MNKFSSYFSAVNRGDNPFRVVSNACHEGFQTSLAECNAEWVLIPSPEGKSWDNDYRKMPFNVVEVSKEQFNNFDYIDLTMSHTLNQINEMRNIANFFGIKHINLNHIYPHPSFNDRFLRRIKTMLLDSQVVFTTEHQASEWGYNKDECKIINHGIDCEHFKGWNPKSNKILTVGNFYKDRGSELGYDIYSELKAMIGEEHFVHVGKSNDGSSNPAENYDILAEIYRSCGVFVNTCHRSVLPTVLLEAMATGMPIITKSNPTIENIIQNGENGFIANTTKEMAECLVELNKDIDLTKKIGDNARKTIKEKYNMDKFTREWNQLFKELAID